MLGNCANLWLSVRVLNIVKVGKATVMIDVSDMQNIVIE